MLVNVTKCCVLVEGFKLVVLKYLSFSLVGSCFFDGLSSTMACDTIVQKPVKFWELCDYYNYTVLEDR